MAAFLESERLWYRAPAPADAPVITAYLSDPRVRRGLGIGRFPFNEHGERKWIETRSEPPQFDAVKDISFVVGLKGEEVLIGGTGLHQVQWLHRNAEWGIYIGRPELWGTGYGREMAGAMLRYAFGTLNLHRVSLRVNADNAGGIRAYEAAGFRREGVLRQAIWVDGVYVDQLVMAVLREEWRDAP
jgi:RimJ/RimL family protein N-acetyltransferase